MPNLRFRKVLTEAEQEAFQEALHSQPFLRIERVEEGSYTLRGAFKVNDENAVEIGSFPLEISVPRNFPKAPPVIREVGGLIPHSADWHMHTDGTCCIELAADFYLRGPQTLREYLDGPLRSYFLAQLHFAAFQRWPRDEDRGHGTEGLGQLCQERLGTSDVRLVTKMILLIQEWRDSRKERCPCGSHRKISKCHDALFVKIQAWPPEVRQGLLNDLARCQRANGK